MSRKHPTLAITGSTGAGTTTVKQAFEHIFRRENFRAASISGDCFHLHTREEFKQILKQETKEKGGHISHFRPEGNDFGVLEQLFECYGKDGLGRYRYYRHDDHEARYQSQRFDMNLRSGEFYEDIRPDTNLLYYEGLHVW